jgi:murein L,D-transpeptidase YcbB/YkuD
MNIGLSGGSNYVISSNANANIVQASVSGSSLVLYGSSVGSDSVAVCASGGGCNTLSVTVNSASTTTSTQTPVVNGTLLTQIQSLQSVVVQVLSQIQSIQNQLAQLVAQVSSGSGNSNNNSNSNTTSASPAASSPYYFTEFLNIGSQDAEVTALQQRLSTLGFYSGPVTGFYGALTEAAVKQYQTKHGILPATGYIGPSTRTALNAGN